MSTADVDNDSHDSSIELDTIFEDGESQSGIYEFSQACLPAHIRPGSLAPFARRHEPREAIPLCAVGRADVTEQRTPASPLSNYRRSGRLAGVKVLLLQILKFFRILWRKLKKVGGVVERLRRIGSSQPAN